MTTATPELPDLLSAQQAADLIGVHINTMFKYLRDGTVPGKRLGAKWYIDAARLAEVLKAEDAA